MRLCTPALDCAGCCLHDSLNFLDKSNMSNFGPCWPEHTTAFLLICFCWPFELQIYSHLILKFPCRLWGTLHCLHKRNHRGHLPAESLIGKNVSQLLYSPVIHFFLNHVHCKEWNPASLLMLEPICLKVQWVVHSKVAVCSQLSPHLFEGFLAFASLT